LPAPTAGSVVGGSAAPLHASTSDSGSGVASVRYEVRPTGGGSFTPITTSTTAPFDGSWNTSGLATGDYDLRPFVTDRAGNTFTGATVTVHVDASAPTVALASPGSTLSGTVALNATVTGNAATKVTFFASHAGANSWTQIGVDATSPYSVSFDTTKLGDGVYDLRAVVTDSVGNTSQDTRTNIRIDNTAPVLVSSAPADGSTVSSASSIELVTNEPATPSNVALDAAGTVTPAVSGPHILSNTGPLAPALHP